MDIVRLDNEQGTSLPTVGSDSIFFQPGKQYRLVFMGDGDQLRGQVYELPNTDVPVVDITTTDGTYALGASGLVVVNNATETGYTGGADVTFDNFLMLAGEPRLTVALVDPNVEVSRIGCKALRTCPQPGLT